MGEYGPFIVHLHSKSAKSADMTTKIFFLMLIWASKNAEFYGAIKKFVDAD
jgi:hypothetical protein